MARFRRRSGRRSASAWGSSGSRLESRTSKTSSRIFPVHWRRFLRRAAAPPPPTLGWLLVPPLAAADDFDALRREFLDAINAERARDGVVPLRLSRPLSGVAQDLAEDLARRGSRAFGEISESEVMSRAEKAGYPVKTLTEVFTQVDGSVGEVVESWPRRDEKTWKSLVRGDSRDLGVGAAILNDAPIYIFLLGLSADDYLAGRAAEYHDLVEMRRQMLARVNAERRSRSLPAFSPGPLLDRIAQAYADDMLKRSHYGHVDP